MNSFIIIFAVLLSGQPNFHCEVFGTFYEVKYPEQANLLVYEETSEAFADLQVFETDSKLYATQSGMWYFEDKIEFADYRVYFVDKPAHADFTVYFTRFESFAGCR